MSSLGPWGFIFSGIQTTHSSQLLTSLIDKNKKQKTQAKNTEIARVPDLNASIYVSVRVSPDILWSIMVRSSLPQKLFPTRQGLRHSWQVGMQEWSLVV